MKLLRVALAGLLMVVGLSLNVHAASKKAGELDGAAKELAILVGVTLGSGVASNCGCCCGCCQCA